MGVQRGDAVSVQWVCNRGGTVSVQQQEGVTVSVQWVCNGDTVSECARGVQRGGTVSVQWVHKGGR